MKEKLYSILGIALLIVIVITIALSSNYNKPPVVSNTTPNTNPSTTKKSGPDISTKDLPGLQKGGAPWMAEITNLKRRLAAIGLPALSAEGTALHIHQHLDLFIEGRKIAVPAMIGISQAERFISPIHVHEDTGVIHVESPTIQDFNLGQFFDVWGVQFSSECIGGYCVDEYKKLKVYIDGKLYDRDPRKIILTAHQEIAIIFGIDYNAPKIIPQAYTFPFGE